MKPLPGFRVYAALEGTTIRQISVEDRAPHTTVVLNTPGSHKQ